RGNADWRLCLPKLDRQSSLLVWTCLAARAAAAAPRARGDTTSAGEPALQADTSLLDRPLLVYTFPQLSASIRPLLSRVYKSRTIDSWLYFSIPFAIDEASTFQRIMW